MPSIEEFATSIDTFWTWATPAPQQKRHPLRLPTVITSSATSPSARTMVLRQVVDESFIFFTDRRSVKVSDVQTQPNSCLHSYEISKRRQLLIFGPMQIVDNHALLPTWRQKGLHRFKDYGASAVPGEPEPKDGYTVTKEEAKLNFTVLQLQAKRIEILKLQSDVHQRIRWDKTPSGWICTRLTP